MTARIFCKVGELAGLSAEVGDEAILGRSRQATIPLAADLVSGEHARIRRDPHAGCYVLEDLGSTNGTELDGVKVRGGERLGHLHVITLAGTYDLMFQDMELSATRHGEPRKETAPTAESEPPWTDTTQVDSLPPPLPAAIAGSDEAPEGTFIDPSPVGIPDFLARKAEEVRTAKAPAYGLEVLRPEGDVSRFRLKDGENVVGRGESADLKLDLLDVSRRHAVLTVAGAKVTVRDLGSSNHTYVDGVEAEGPVPLTPSGKLAFGSLEARLILWQGEET